MLRKILFILVLLVIFLGLPSILATIFYHTDTGLSMHEELANFCGLFLTPQNTAILGTTLYWLVFLLITILLIRIISLCIILKFINDLATEKAKETQTLPAP